MRAAVVRKDPLAPRLVLIRRADQPLDLTGLVFRRRPRRDLFWPLSIAWLLAVAAGLVISILAL